uniref:Chitin-binding type-2 domain-containing protein n=1 Tax=Lygus hesperus TaxID=30085 RepID=A0A0A9YH35_LYGHE
MDIRGFLVIAAILACGSAYDCNGSTYDYPRSDSCWKYQHCTAGTTKPQERWCFPLLRRFSRTDLRCEWFWEVDCTAQPPPPPTPAPTQPPPTPPSTAAPTRPPTVPTIPPTSAPTRPPTVPTRPPTKAPTKQPEEATSEAP